MLFNSFFKRKTSHAAFTPVSRSLISGFVGGLAGTAVKTLIEQFIPVRKIEQHSAQLKIINDLSTKITGSPISAKNEELAEQLVGFPFGVSLGTAYGYGKKNREFLRLSDGAVFGVTTWISTHETSLPLLGLEAKPKQIPLKLQANELFAHLAFGITTELVRSFVNEKLKKS